VGCPTVAVDGAYLISAVVPARPSQLEKGYVHDSILGAIGDSGDLSWVYKG